jgi:YkoY family integral membrane protein
MTSMLATLFAMPLFAFLGQSFEWSDAVVVGMLVLLEGVLSIDNALVLGILAKRLPPHLRPRALSYGLIGAFVFRVIAIATASFLLRWTFVKLLGGGYLIFIAVKHLFFEAQEEHPERIELDAAGHPVLIDVTTGGELTPAQEDIEIRERVPVGVSLVTGEQGGGAASGPSTQATKGRRYPSFWATVAVIELTDVAFAVDSILAAMALAGSRQEKLWVVIAGGILGVVLMRFAAAVFIKLLDRFPRFEESAYLLVIVIGLKLVADWGLNSDWGPPARPAVVARQASGWSEALATVEERRRGAVATYESWLDTSWPLTAGTMRHETEAHVEVAAPSHEASKTVDVPHVPHLLDFHDLRRPECIAFWAIMAACFGLGFVPRKAQATPA